MTLHALPGCTELLADAVCLARTAERLSRRGADPRDGPLLRALVDDLGAVTRVLEERVGPGGAAPSRPGRLHLDHDGDEVRVRGRGPAPEGDVVRAALLTAAGQRRPGPPRPGDAATAERLWTALVAIAGDGLDPPSAVPTPLNLLGRARPQRG